jgi:hypothetical protein
VSCFVIAAVFTVEWGKVPLGRDVLAKWWGAGHQLSYCDGRTLTLVVEMAASDSERAFDLVVSRAGPVWEVATGQVLPAPSSLRLQAAVPQQEKVVAGPVGRGPDRLFAEAAASRAAQLRAAVAALSDLQPRSGWSGQSESGFTGGSIPLELPPPFPPAG